MNALVVTCTVLYIYSVSTCNNWGESKIVTPTLVMQVFERIALLRFIQSCMSCTHSSCTLVRACVHHTSSACQRYLAKRIWNVSKETNNQQQSGKLRLRSPMIGSSDVRRQTWRVQMAVGQGARLRPQLIRKHQKNSMQ